MRHGEAEELRGKHCEGVLFERTLPIGMALEKKQEAERPWSEAGVGVGHKRIRRTELAFKATACYLEERWGVKGVGKRFRTRRSSKKTWTVGTRKLPGGRRTQAWKGGFDKGRGGKGNFIRQAVKLQQRQAKEAAGGTGWRMPHRRMEMCSSLKWKLLQIWGARYWHLLILEIFSI